MDQMRWRGMPPISRLGGSGAFHDTLSRPSNVSTLIRNASIQHVLCCSRWNQNNTFCISHQYVLDKNSTQNVSVFFAYYQHKKCSEFGLTYYTKCVILIHKYQGGVPDDFCRTFKRGTKKAGLSQKDFAEKIGLNARTYASYERGERDISTALLLNICTTRNISSDRLLGNESEFSIVEPPAMCKIPVIGEVAAGFQSLADMQIIDYMMCDASCLVSKDSRSRKYLL